MAPSLKLYYFNLPGRAETIRIMLNYGGIPFEDILIGRDDWAQWKPKMPLGQVPVLEVDGKMLAQSSAIERYVANLAGLMPEDPWEAAKVDELVALVNETQDMFIATYSIQDADARVKSRQDLVAGPLKTKLGALAGCLGAAGGEFFGGSKPTYADFLTFKALSGLAGGYSMDGIPANVLDDYPELKAFHNRVAALPAVAKMYEGVTEGPRVSYKVLP